MAHRQADHTQGRVALEVETTLCCVPHSFARSSCGVGDLLGVKLHSKLLDACSSHHFRASF